MENKLDLIINEIKQFVDKEFIGKDYFTIIYGSYAYKLNKKDSDLDMVTVCNSFSKQDIEKMVNFVKFIHRKYDLKIDYEVPYEKKVLVSNKTVENGIRGKGFNKIRGKFYIPHVIKSKKFLNSDKILMRLMLNAMTTKNIFVTGNKKYYSKIRKEAFKNMVGIIFSARNVKSASPNEFVNLLMKDKDREDELYLGYKNIPVIRNDLIKNFKKVL